MDVASVDSRVEGLYMRLRERLAMLRPRVVGDVMRTFLEVSSAGVAKGLWSLEFGFDEDDGRVAVIGARFGNGVLAARTGAQLPGYEVQLVLPKLLPKVTADAGGSKASEHMLGTPTDPTNLVARFVRSLAELGAYRLIEPLEAEAIEIELL